MNYLFRRLRARWDAWLCRLLGHEVAHNARRTTCYACGWFYSWED